MPKKQAPVRKLKGMKIVGSEGKKKAVKKADQSIKKLFEDNKSGRYSGPKDK